MFISLLLKMINGFPWAAKTMASPFKRVWFKFILNCEKFPLALYLFIFLQLLLKKFGIFSEIIISKYTEMSTAT